MGLKKGMTNNPKGKPKGALSTKRKEWEAMGEHITKEWTQFIIDEGNRMIQERDFENFYPLYKDILQFFKPKLAATNITGELRNPEPVEIIIRKPDDAKA